MKPHDRTRVTVSVRTDPCSAFTVFTEEIDLWWRRGPRYRFGSAPRGTLALEPRLGGRLYERFEGPPPETFEAGRVSVWEPCARLVFSWRISNFAPGEDTEVEVLFAPDASGTAVTVEHRGWAALRPDHPVRHGLEPAVFIAMQGRWWGELASSLRVHIAGKATA